ncbi:MAG: aldo/keto reductase [Cytophagaceae bacterium]|nr:aldo/keto reductase [Cytophagaceae bacterium]MDW8455306.1 aldo/keto reductase [Cytophagaceae bacterium]
MQYRKFGKTGWQVSEVGYGMWGLASWKGSDEREYMAALDMAVEMGCNFFDTAWAYGAGLSEQVLGKIIKKHDTSKLYVATKVPPKNRKWPALGEYTLQDCYPYEHIIEYTEKSLKNLGVDTIDLQQFHTWHDNWAYQDEWKEAVIKLKKEGKIQHMGISVNRWEPENCLKALDSGLIDSIQVIYNIFDQAPEDALFPVCERLNIAIIARVPFDEGTLTGTLTKDTVFPEDDWRSTYFVPENLIPSVERADKLKPLVPSGMTMAEMALRFILHNKTVCTVIPGMRTTKNVKQNMAVSDNVSLPMGLINELKKHRWDRTPTSWSQ